MCGFSQYYMRRHISDLDVVVACELVELGRGSVCLIQASGGPFTKDLVSSAHGISSGICVGFWSGARALVLATGVCSPEAVSVDLGGIR